MKNNIVLFSHVYHAFILNEIEYAARVYEKVYLLCPYNNELRKKCDLYANVEYKIFDTKPDIFKFLKSLRYLKKDLLKEIGRSIKAKKFDRHYVYIIWASLYCEKILMSYVQKLDDLSNTVILSMWFGQTAYASCRLKERYPYVKAYSLAHSFEIDDKKNRYIDYLLKGKNHNILDGVYFISGKVKKQYEEMHAIPNGWDTSKNNLVYLGTIKKIEGYSAQSVDSVLRVMSCSNCIEVKRIELIIKALRIIQGYKIEWVHFGEGPLLESLKEMTLDLPNNISVKWMGRKDNEYIHRYIVNNPIDVFINTSFSEGIPVSLMEAIAYGIPAIVTNVGGNSEIIIDNSNGYVISENLNAKELADKINQFYSLTEIEKKQMRESAIKIFNEKFNAKSLRIPFYEGLKDDISE